MKIRATRAVAMTAAVVTLLGGLSACGSNSGSSSEALDENAKTEISFAGWSFDMTPEFKQIADAFMKEHPNIKVNLKQYSADDYDKQMTADLSSGSQPDVFPIKNLQKYYTYAAESGGLADISDVANSFKGDKNIDVSKYDLDGKYYAMPYRQDSWVLYYNKDMFKKAGVETPTAKWTWDDYTAAAKQLKEKLPAAGFDSNSVYPMYMHTTWQSPVQSFAFAQSGKSADDTFFKGDFSYMDAYYKRALEWQDQGLTMSYNTITANSVQYQPQFGTQKAAMLPMGTWYAAVLVSQQKSGDAEKFEWGMAPIPQNPDKKSDTTLTFGDPTGLAVSSKISGQKLAAAKEFVKFCAGEGGAKALAELATTPAYFSDDVVKTYFATQGMPTDDLSKQAWSDHKIMPENPVGEGTDTIQSNLKTANNAIMTETSSIKDALQAAVDQSKNAGVLK